VLSRLVDAIVIGVGLGSVYALVAFGYNLILGTMGILNLAQGQILGLGIMLSYALRVTLGWNPFLTLAVVLLVGALVGVAEESATVRFLRGRAREDGWLVTTLGAALVIQGALLLIWGGAQRTYPPLIEGTGPHLGDVPVRPQVMVALGAAVLLTLALAVVNRFTRAGAALAAIAEDREAAALRGIDVRRAAWTTFAAGAGISAGAGWVIAPITFATTSLGFTLGLQGFVAMIIGGQGRAAAALVGGLLLGIGESMGTHFGPGGLADVYGFVVLVAVVAVRPAGIFPRPQVRGA
jgi:branched-chain amino acid transport system permease protein